MATKPRGGGLKALVARPLRKELFCGFPEYLLYLSTHTPTLLPYHKLTHKHTHTHICIIPTLLSHTHSLLTYHTLSSYHKLLSYHTQTHIISHTNSHHITLKLTSYHTQSLIISHTTTTLIHCTHTHNMPHN